MDINIQNYKNIIKDTLLSKKEYKNIDNTLNINRIEKHALKNNHTNYFKNKKIFYTVHNYIFQNLLHA